MDYFCSCLILDYYYNDDICFNCGVWHTGWLPFKFPTPYFLLPCSRSYSSSIDNAVKIVNFPAALFLVARNWNLSHWNLSLNAQWRRTQTIQLRWRKCWSGLFRRTTHVRNKKAGVAWIFFLQMEFNYDKWSGKNTYKLYHG